MESTVRQEYNAFDDSKRCREKIHFHVRIPIFVPSFVFSRIQWNLPDDVRDGNAIRLVPFRRDRLTYDFDDENEALGILNALFSLIFTWPFIFGIFILLIFNMCCVLLLLNGGVRCDNFSLFFFFFWFVFVLAFFLSLSLSFSFLHKIFRLHNPKMLCTTSWWCKWGLCIFLSLSFSLVFLCIRFTF